MNKKTKMILCFILLCSVLKFVGTCAGSPMINSHNAHTIQNYVFFEERNFIKRGVLGDNGSINNPVIIKNIAHEDRNRLSFVDSDMYVLCGGPTDYYINKFTSGDNWHTSVKDYKFQWTGQDITGFAMLTDDKWAVITSRGDYRTYSMDEMGNVKVLIERKIIDVPHYYLPDEYKGYSPRPGKNTNPVNFVLRKINEDSVAAILTQNIYYYKKVKNIKEPYYAISRSMKLFCISNLSSLNQLIVTGGFGLRSGDGGAVRNKDYNYWFLGDATIGYANGKYGIFVSTGSDQPTSSNRELYHYPLSINNGHFELNKSTKRLNITPFVKAKGMYRMMYRWMQFTSDDYRRGISAFTIIDGTWNGSKMGSDKLPEASIIKVNEIEENQNAEFTSGKFLPVGVVFGVPPRYNKSQIPNDETTFQFGVSKGESISGTNTQSWSNTTRKDSGGKAFNLFPLGWSISGSIGKARSQTRTKSTHMGSSNTYSNYSWKYKSAWIIGLPSDVNFYEFRVKQFENDKQDNVVWSVERNDWIAAPNTLYLSDISPKKNHKGITSYTNVCYDITNPDSDSSVFGDKTNTWKNIVKGLPKFPENNNISRWLKEERTKNWAKRAKTDPSCEYTLVCTTIPTNNATKAFYSETSTQTDMESKSRNIEVEVKAGGFSDKLNFDSTRETSTTLSNNLEWAWGYMPIPYASTKVNPITLEAYLFLPKKGVHAKDLPWSSDYMKKNNIITFAVAYHVKEGFMKK